MSEKWNEGQLKAITDTLTNMIVSASAGSGKTATMIERVLRLILGKHIPVSRILMLSFNDAIAEEIKEKMAKALLGAIKDDSVRDKDFLRQQIDELGTADITTMHSFCNSLIKEYFDKVGVDPAYSIMDDKESSVIINKCINEVFDEYFEKKDPDFMLLKDKLSSDGDDNLRGAVEEIFSFSNSLLNGEEWLERAVAKNYAVPLEKAKPVHYLMRELTTKINIAITMLNEAVTALDTSEYLGMTDALDFLMKYEGEESILKFADMRGKAPIIANKRPSVGTPEHEYYYNARDAYNAVLDFVAEIYPVPYAKMASDHETDAVIMRKLIELVSRFKVYYNREKAEVNKLDFDDMEHYAVEILSDPSIREVVKSKYDYICIDEYQDTNEVQNSILEAVSNGHNLFMVGDPKQSIYKFRFTEPEIFIKRMTGYKDGKMGEVVELDNNYRSSPLILDRVNNVFDFVMRQDRAGMIREVYSSLRCGLADTYENAEAEDVPNKVKEPFEVYLYEGDKKEREVMDTPGTYRVSEDDGIDNEMSDASIEAEYIAEKIGMLISSKIYDAKIGKWREARYDDMVILASNRTPHVKRVLEILERIYNIPIDSTPLKRKEEPQEVKILLDFLRAIDNPLQDIPLYTVMKVFFDFRDSDFVTMRSYAPYERNFYNIIYGDIMPDSPIKGRVETFKKRFDEFRLMSTFMDVHDFLETIIEKTAFKRKLLMSKDGRISIDNIDKFLSSLKEKKHASTIQEFLYAYDNYNITSDVDATSQCLENSIHTSTIHGSKGLEYPIVFMIQLGASFASGHNTKSQFLLDKDYGIAVKTYNEQNKTVYSNWLMKGILDKKDQAETEEKFRLFYVAMTRAKSCLYMIGKVAKDKSPFSVTHKFSDILYEIGEKNKDFNIVFKSATPADEVSHRMLEDGTRAFNIVDYSDEERDRYNAVFSYTYPYVEATHLAQKYTVTSINHEEREKEEYVPELYETEKTSIGSIYHKFMEYVNYEADTIDAIKCEMARMIEEKILTEEEVNNIDINDVYKCMNSAIIKKAKVSRHDREKKFMMCLPLSEVKEGASDEKVIVQGIADLVIYGEKNILVDFKKSSQPEFLLRESYRKQLDLYKFALEKSMNITIDEMYLYVIGQDKIIDMNN